MIPPFVYNLRRGGRNRIAAIIDVAHATVNRLQLVKEAR